MADADSADKPSHDELRDRTPLHALLGFKSSRPEPGSGKGQVRMPVRPEAFGPTANLHAGPGALQL